MENQRKTGVGKGSVFTCFNAAVSTLLIRAGLYPRTWKGIRLGNLSLQLSLRHFATRAYKRSKVFVSLSLAAAYSLRGCVPTEVLKRECACR